MYMNVQVVSVEEVLMVKFYSITQYTQNIQYIGMFKFTHIFKFLYKYVKKIYK